MRLARERQVNVRVIPASEATSESMDLAYEIDLQPRIPYRSPEVGGQVMGYMKHWEQREAEQRRPRVYTDERI